jgi:tRNA/rRNA methyltransferase
MVSVVLLEPQHPGNIGSAARVMANFGFSKLVLINPKCEVDIEARRFAKNAQKVLKDAKVCGSEALEGFDLVIGTTSKVGSDFNIPRIPLLPSDLGVFLSRIRGGKVALLLGREGDGLSNKEILACDFIVKIPTSAVYDSLNISHALAILLYEITKQGYSSELMQKYAPINKVDKEQLLKLLDQALKGMNFSTEGKRETQRMVWKRMISKSLLTRREAFALMGFFKKIK